VLASKPASLNVTVLPLVGPSTVAIVVKSVEPAPVDR
jgi:hypothetical protein